MESDRVRKHVGLRNFKLRHYPYPPGADWRPTNPYSGDPVGLKIAFSGFDENYARCHGLQAVSGGLAPDLRYLDKAEAGDEWFIDRFRRGYTQNVKSPRPYENSQFLPARER